MQISADSAAVISGGASGLGHATAKRLADAGARVAILDINEEAGQAAAKAIGGMFIATDVTCLLYTSPSPRDRQKSRMPSSA